MGYAGLWLAAAVFTISSSTVSAAGSFLEPVRELFGVEFYEFNSERYGIYIEPVTWEEASRLCPAANGSLVEYLETEVGLPKFISRALAESAVSYGALWIGGKYMKPDNSTNITENTGVWKWVVSDVDINVEVEDATAFPMTKYPFWVSKPNLTSEGNLCLGADRRLHHLPLIVPIDCKQKRPFICKIPTGGSSDVNEIKPSTTIDGKEFHIFAGELTWVEALSRCKDLGMSLAKLTTDQEFMLIGNRMKRHRPIMENAWIGGFFSESKWKWIHNDEDINVSNSTLKPNEPIAWYRPRQIIMEGCLLADRHVCDHFVYVEAMCNRRRNFICEKRAKEGNEGGLIPIRGYDDLYISTYRDTWFRAQNVCKVCLEGSLLQLHPTVDDVTAKLKIMYYGMAQTKAREVRHLWLGGYLYGSTFKWTDAPEPEPPFEKAITTAKFQGLDGKGENGILQFCDVDFKVDKEMKKYKCLNIDRENQKNFFMYGLKCDLKQSFICKATIRKEDIPCRLFNEPIIPTRGNVTKTTPMT